MKLYLVKQSVKIVIILICTYIIIYNQKLYFRLSSLITIILILIINKKRISNKKINIINTHKFNNSLMSFSSFLDEFSNSHLVDKEKYINDEKNLTTIKDNYCRGCRQKNDCYKNKKILVYKFLKTSLENGYSLNVSNQEKQLSNFIKDCKYSNEIISYCDVIKNKNNFSENKNDELFSKQLFGISNTIKNYVFDKNTEVNKNKDILFEIINYSSKYTTIKNFFILDSNIKSFSIKLHITKLTNKIIKKIKRKAERISKNKVTISISKQYKDNVIFISKKINIKTEIDTINFCKESEKVNGDNYTINYNESKTFLSIALSDGMGNGLNAFNESQKTLNLVNKISDSDISIKNKLNLLNTFYNLKEYSDIYATLDYVAIDLINNNASFFKLGSASSFIVDSNGITKEIYNNNLPLGIDQLITTTRVKLNHNDTIIILSDGITETVSSKDLLEIFSSVSHLNIQKINYEIMNKITKKYTQLDDDVSIITIRIKKRID